MSQFMFQYTETQHIALCVVHGYTFKFKVEVNVTSLQARKLVDTQTLAHALL